MSDITIRPFERADRDHVYDIIRHYRGRSDGSLDDYPFPTDRFADRDDRTAVARVAVDTATETVVGVLVLYIYATLDDIRDKLNGVSLPTAATLRPDTVDPDTYGYIASGYVHPDYVRQGIGQQLLAAIETMGLDRGVDVFYTEMWGHDHKTDARALFKGAEYCDVYSSDEYWAASLPESDETCPRCGADCDCVGAIYRKVVADAEPDAPALTADD